jgi:DNA-binding response OmpR family regulator
VGKAICTMYKVLIVEDTIELAEIMRATIERMGLQVFHEVYGENAVEVYETENPDLVLLDIALPDMPGWKILDTIREGGNRPLVIVITAYGDAANRLMGKLQGVYDYLIKPLMPDEIERVVAKALNLPKK